MKRPIVLIILGGFLLGGIGAGAYLYFSKSKAPAAPVGDITVPTPTPKLLLWDDPAGFTMQYPENIEVNKHDEDKENYAHVEFTSSAHPGNLIVWVKDIPKGIMDTAAWGKKMSTPSSAISFDTTLGGKPAQKILISSPVKTVTTGIIYDGVAWSIEAVLTDDVFWQSVYDQVAGSFTFKPTAADPAAPAAADPGSAAVDYSVDEEEVLE